MNTSSQETTPTTPTPAAASETGELFRSHWNQHGVCIDPETVVIADMPKGTRAFIEIGIVHDGSFRVGYTADSSKAGASSPCALDGEEYPTRVAAISAALLDFAKIYQKDKKAVKALEAFHAQLHAGSVVVNRPAVSTVADVALPAEGASLLDRYAAADRRVEEGAPLPKGRFVPDLGVGLISPNPENHRKHFDPVAMQELADSLRQVGQLQPIAVRRLSPDELGELPGVGAEAPAERYEIILGERRWRAFSLSGWPTIEAKVYEGVTRRQAKAAALVENLQRAEINAVEEAEGYRDLIEVEDLTQEQCAARVGRARPTVANAMRLLKLPASVVELIRGGKLTPAHGHALARWEARPLVLRAIADLVARNGTAAGQLEEWNRQKVIPYPSELRQSGLIQIIGRWERPRGWDSEMPADTVGNKDYEQYGSDSVLCFNPAHWLVVVAKEQAAIQAEREAAAVAAKSAAPKKIHSMEDLERGAYREMNKDAQADMAGLLPIEQVVKLPEKNKAAEGEKIAEVVVCTVPGFADRVADALRDLKKADRREILPGIHAKARAAVRKWKKIGPREMVTVSYILLAQTMDAGGVAALSPAAAASQGVKLPTCFASVDCDGYGSRFAEEAGKGLRALTEGDSLGYLRAVVDHYLVSSFLDGGWDGKNEPSAEDYYWEDVRRVATATLELLRHILCVEELGLLEETKAGRKKLAEAVRAQDWYAAAYAKAEKGKDLDEEDEAEAEGDSEGKEAA